MLDEELKVAIQPEGEFFRAKAMPLLDLHLDMGRVLISVRG